MAEITAFRNNALPYPVYGVPWTIVVPMLDEDGDPVTGLTCDSEVSINGDTGADCTNEATEIPFTTATNKGMYYLTLTAAEMTGDIITVTIYSGATTTQATCVVLYPRKLVSLATGTSQGGAAGYITLAAGAVVFNGRYDGCLCVATIDTLVEARLLQVSTSSNDQCTVTPGWNVAPDADDTYIIYNPEGRAIATCNVRAISDDLAAADNAEAMFDGTGYAGGTIVFQADVTTVHGSALTETSAGYLAASIGKFFDVATPLGTINLLGANSINNATFAADVATTAYATNTLAKAIWERLVAAMTTAGSVGELVTKLVRSTTPANTLTVDANSRAATDLQAILGTALTETQAGYITAAFKKLFDVATPLLVASSAMRGTDSAYTGTPPTAAAIVTAAWTALLAGTDFATAASIGKLLKDFIDAAISTRGTSTLSAGAKMDLADSLNQTGVTDLKSKLGTLPASGDWNTVTPDNSNIGVAATQATTAATQATTAATQSTTAATQATNAASDAAAIKAKLPTGGALMHAAGAAVAKSPATLAAADVSGNLPADVKAYTVQPTIVLDASTATGVFPGTVLANAPTGGLTAQQTRDALALALTPATPTPATGVDGRIIAVAINAAAPPLASATGALPAGAFANQPAASVTLTPADIADISDDVIAGISDELAVITAKTDLITADTVIVNSPVGTGGALTLVAGNAYTGTLALTITATAYGDKALSGTTHAFAIQTRTKYNQGDGFGTATGTVTAAISGSDLAYTISLTAAQTIALATNPPGQAPTHKYEIKTIYTDGTIRRIIGDLTISRGVTNA